MSPAERSKISPTFVSIDGQVFSVATAYGQKMVRNLMLSISNSQHEFEPIPPRRERRKQKAILHRVSSK